MPMIATGSCFMSMGSATREMRSTPATHAANELLGDSARRMPRSCRNQRRKVMKSSLRSNQHEERPAADSGSGVAHGTFGPSGPDLAEAASDDTLAGSLQAWSLRRHYGHGRRPHRARRCWCQQSGHATPSRFPSVAASVPTAPRVPRRALPVCIACAITAALTAAATPTRSVGLVCGIGPARDGSIEATPSWLTDAFHRPHVWSSSLDRDRRGR